MKQRNFIVCLSVVHLFGISQVANAFWGVGDITFDPTSYGQLISIYQQGVKMYKSSIETLDTMQNIKKTIEEAKSGVDELKNINLKKMGTDLTSLNLKSSDKLNALRSHLYGLDGTLNGNSNFIQYQLQRVKNLETLAGLQEQSAKNLVKASDKTSADANTKLTAQNTAVIATLLAAEQQRKVEQDITAVDSAKKFQNLKKDSSLIFDAY